VPIPLILSVGLFESDKYFDQQLMVMTITTIMVMTITIMTITLTT